MEILRQNLKTSNNLHKWVFQTDIDPKQTTRLITEGLKNKKVNIFDKPS